MRHCHVHVGEAGGAESVGGADCDFCRDAAVLLLCLIRFNNSY